MTSSTTAESLHASQRDAGLVASARRGDIAAFEALIDGHLDRGYRIASVLLGAPDADAAVVDASLAAWRHLPRLSDPAQFGTWFDAILVGACRMRARAADAAGEPGAVGDRSVSGADGRPTERSSPDAAKFEAALARLDRAFDRLDPTDRAVLALHELAGQAAAQIAGTIHEPVGVVRVRLAEARAALLAALEAEA